MPPPRSSPWAKSNASSAKAQRPWYCQISQKEISNFKNTVSALKRLVGRPLAEPEVDLYEKRFINAQLVEGERGEAAVSVQYRNEQQEFTFTQLCAMFLGKVKEFTAKELTIPVSDCVISCPTWFTDAQRRSLLAASSVAGLNCLRLMNDTTACTVPINRSGSRIRNHKD